MGCGRRLDRVHHWVRRKRRKDKTGWKSLGRGADLDKPQVERVPGRVISEKGPRIPLPQGSLLYIIPISRNT